MKECASKSSISRKGKGIKSQESERSDLTDSTMESDVSNSELGSGSGSDCSDGEEVVFNKPVKTSEPTKSKEKTVQQFKKNRGLLSRVRNSLQVMLLEIDASYGDLITTDSFQKYVAENSSSLRSLRGL